MQATITYMLSETAQRERIVATGQPAAREQTETIDIQPEDIDLFNVRTDGTLAASTYGTYADLNEALGYLRQRRDEERAKTEKHKALLQSYVDADAEIAARIDSRPPCRRGYEANGHLVYEERGDLKSLSSISEAEGLLRKMPLTSAACERFSERSKKANLERERDEAADQAAKKAAEVAKETAKTAYIHQWIAEHAEPEIQEQHREKLLSRSAALTMIADRAFADFPPEFTYNDKFCRDSECPCGHTDIDTIPTSKYQTWKQLKAKLPAGTTFDFHSVREHIAQPDFPDYDDEYESPTAGPKHIYVSLHVPVGPFVFDRDVELK